MSTAITGELLRPIEFRFSSQRVAALGSTVSQCLCTTELHVKSHRQIVRQWPAIPILIGGRYRRSRISYRKTKTLLDAAGRQTHTICHEILPL